jgi:hypothetical protein
MMNSPNGDMCPPNLRASIDDYVNLGQPTGGFLRAVLENDLRRAIEKADHINVWLIPHIVAYLYNNVPSLVWGSPALVEAHIRTKHEARVRMAQESGGPRA